MDHLLPPGQLTEIPTGIAAVIPPHLCGRLSPRSGLARKGIVGQIGTLDSDYRGPITAVLLNHTSVPYKIEAGERVIQLVLIRIALPEPREI